MMAPKSTGSLIGAFQKLSVGSMSASRIIRASLQQRSPSLYASPSLQYARAFSTTRPAFGTWLEPSIDRKKKMAKGRPRVPTGGSTKGTTVIWGDYGLRMKDHHRRISAKHLKMAEDTIKVRLRGEKYRLYKRKCCNIGVYVSGNEVSSSRRHSTIGVLTHGRCVWVKERVHSTTGLRGFPSAKFCSRLGAGSTNKSCAMHSDWRATSYLVSSVPAFRHH